MEEGLQAWSHYIMADTSVVVSWNKPVTSGCLAVQQVTLHIRLASLQMLPHCTHLVASCSGLFMDTASVWETLHNIMGTRLL